MKKLTKKHKNYLDKKSRRGHKKSKRGRYFRKKKASHLIINTRATYSRSFLEKNKRQREKKDVYITPPKNLCIINNTVEVLNFISELKNYLNGKEFIKRMVFDLENITNIEIGSISMLLSVVEEFSTQGILCSGSLPKDERCKRIFELSGFLSHMSIISGSKIEMMESANTILKRGKDTLNSEKTGEIIKSSIKKITGKEDHFKPLFSMINEININSIEHAYKKDKNRHWFFSIYHNQKESKIVFVFADNGLGIVNRLNRTYSRRFFEKMNLKSDGDILLNAFLKKYGSRYAEQPNRNKGLPSIKSIQDKNYINNLIVITNGIFINLQKNTEIKLAQNYSGTFYYWEFDKKCVDLYYNERRITI